MAQKSLFWNAMPDSAFPTGYDRNYNADDISDWLATVLTTGVIKTTTALKVTAAGGMSVSVAAGKSVINGKPYTNDAAYTLTVPTAPTGTTNRVDLVVLRFDKRNTVRATNIVYITGSGATAPAVKRDLVYYDLVLAMITVQPNATSINSGDITDLRGDNDSVVTIDGGTSLGYCPWLVAAKGYDDYYDAIVLQYEDTVTLASSGTTVNFNIPQYGWTGVDILTVYTNGMRESPEHYTVTGNSTIVFDVAKIAGTIVQVVVDKTIDGEGLGTALEQYEELQAIVLNLQNVDAYNYVCNGVNDNVRLSAIAQTWLNGGNDSSSKKINVYGTFGCTAPNEGAGTVSNRYKWFSVGQSTSKSRRIIFDFSACSAITLPITGNTYNDIFYGEDAYIIGANVIANNNATGTMIRAFSSAAGVVRAENCRFWITANLTSYISQTGTFVNCRGSVTCTGGNAWCYYATAGALLRVEGGEYYAYSPTAYTSAVVYGTSATLVAILYAVNCPAVTRSGFVQSYAVYTIAGKVSITDTITTLAITATGANIRGTLVISKAGQM